MIKRLDQYIDPKKVTIPGCFVVTGPGIVFPGSVFLVGAIVMENML